jgi:hypothetical protein
VVKLIKGVEIAKDILQAGSASVNAVSDAQEGNTLSAITNAAAASTVGLGKIATIAENESKLLNKSVVKQLVSGTTNQYGLLLSSEANAYAAGSNALNVTGTTISATNVIVGATQPSAQTPATTAQNTTSDSKTTQATKNDKEYLK